MNARDFFRGGDVLFRVEKNPHPNPDFEGMGLENSPEFVPDETISEASGGEVEYGRLDREMGREMVRELESFLGAELACPRDGRRISFRNGPRNGLAGSVIVKNPNQE